MKPKKAPGFSQPIPLPFGELPSAIRDPLKYLLKAREEHGDVLRFRIGPLVAYFLFDPEHVTRFLETNQTNYVRGWLHRPIGQLLGDNLVASDGATWQRRRNVAQGAFDTVEYCVEDSWAAVEEMVSRWHAAAAAKRPVDIGVEMQQVLMAQFGLNVIGQDISRPDNEIGCAFREIATYLQWRVLHPFTTPPLWVPTASNRRVRRALQNLTQDLRQVVGGCPDSRTASGGESQTALSQMNQHCQVGGDVGLTPDELQSEILMLILAGFETTAVAVTWTWYLLATHPECQDGLRGEIDSVIGEGPLRAAHLPDLKRLRSLILESLRVYPPLWAIPRTSVNEDVMGEFQIEAGATVAVSPYVTHRHPSFWDHPERFEPERFLSESTPASVRGAYIPFLSGPHDCIGGDLALLNMTAILVGALRRFHVDETKDRIVPNPSLLLRTNQPLRLTVRAR